MADRPQSFRWKSLSICKIRCWLLCLKKYTLNGKCARLIIIIIVKVFRQFQKLSQPKPFCNSLTKRLQWKSRGVVSSSCANYDTILRRSIECPTALRSYYITFPSFQCRKPVRAVHSLHFSRIPCEVDSCVVLFWPCFRPYWLFLVSFLWIWHPYASTAT